MSSSVLAELTHGVLRDYFGPVTLFRGRNYAEDGRVGAPRITPHGDGTVTAVATVSGSTEYRTRLTVGRRDGTPALDSRCSCPVGDACKHGAALAVVAAERPAAAAESAWEPALRDLISQLADDVRPDHDLTPLALEVTLEGGRTAYNRAPSIRVRPLRLGARGQWVKTGAEWQHLNSARPGHDFPRAQLLPMRALGREVKLDRGFWVADANTQLDDFGPHVVSLLTDAMAGGVRLLAGPGIKAVEVVDHDLSVVTQARHTDDGTELRLGVSLDAPSETRLFFGPRVLAVGWPAHSVGLLDEGTLRIARLAHPMTRSAQTLLTDESPIVVPEAEVDRLASLLAPLGRLMPVESPDGSVEVPEPPTPELNLTVAWHSATHASLTWEWSYAGRRYPLDSDVDLGLVRDLSAEDDLRKTVAPDLLTLTEVRDGDALAFAVQALPTIRDLPGVHVTEKDQPDFRQSEAAPDIRFELAEPDDGDDAQTDWFDLSVVIAIEDEVVPLADVLAALTRGDAHLVLPSGLYLDTDRPEFDKLHDVVRAAADLGETRQDRIGVGAHDLGMWAELADIGTVPSEAAEWVTRALALRDLEEIPRPEPTGLATELRHYQLDGFHWLCLLYQHRLGGILADDMGLGKTLQVLALITHAISEGTKTPFLVVAPTSVLQAWRAETERHAPDLRMGTVTRRTDDVAAIAADANLVVTTYAMLRLEQDQFAAREWAGLVLDEAQQIKNHQSKTYAAARRLEAPFRVAVTGTPFENRLMELWSLLSIVAPGLYPQPRMFRERVVTPVEKRGDASALKRFRRRLGPFVLRRTKELVAADLPPKQEQVLPVELGPGHRKLYDAHLAKERQRILHLLDDFNENRVAILTALTRLRQLALDPALVDDEHDDVGSAKLDVLVDQLEEITAEGHRALVFSQFTTFLGRVRDRLDEEGIATTYLDGSTRDRGSAIDRFREGDTPVFLISLKAGGVGLTLTEADYVYVLDPWWNPAAEAQAVDRAHRIGQERQVMVYRLVSTDTIEEKVMELKGRKAELFAQVIDGGSASSTAIDADDIRQLFDE